MKASQRTFVLVLFALLAGSIVVHRHDADAGAGLLFAAVVWFAAGRSIAPILVALFMARVICPGCYEELQTIDRWKCGCGYTDFRERHFARFVCPKCGGRIVYLNCPRCESTIIL